MLRSIILKIWHNWGLAGSTAQLSARSEIFSLRRRFSSNWSDFARRQRPVVRRNNTEITHTGRRLLAPSKNTIGLLGENAAASYLLSRGYRILHRNWRYKRRELDIVAVSPDPGAGNLRQIVIVEVKSRLTSPYAGRLLFDAISPRKKRRLRSLTLAYLRRNRRLFPRLLGSKDPPFRIDVIGILFMPGGPGQEPTVCALEHLIGAV